MASSDDKQATEAKSGLDPAPAQGINRRDFLNGMAISIAGSALLGSSTAVAMGTEASSAGDLAVAADLGTTIGEKLLPAHTHGYARQS